LLAIALMIGLTGAQALEEGRRIALGTTDDPGCNSCHGSLGQGDLEAGHPRLAGQSRFYLRKQLEDFASGERPSKQMTPIARRLSEEQREDVAAYYASLREAPYPPQPDGDPLRLQRGGALSALGSPERGISACATCHAGFGAGLPPSYPYLAGQLADYTERQLRLWQQGMRRNDPLAVMADIAKALTDEEIRALALYFARVRLPSTAINDLTPAEP